MLASVHKQPQDLLHNRCYQLRCHLDTMCSLIMPHAGTNDGKAFIKMNDVFFKRPKASVANFTRDYGFSGLVEVVVFERSQQQLIGYPTEVRAGPVCCSRPQHCAEVQNIYM